MNLIWINSQIRELDTATVPANCLGFLLGASVFEAVRVNWNSEKRSYCINNVKLHIKRLFESMKIMRMVPEFDEALVENAIINLIRTWNQRCDGYIRITAYIDSPSPGSSVYHPDKVHTNLMISIVDSELPQVNKNISCCVSSWQRIADNVIPPRVKSACNYENTRLAGFEAILNGYDNAIFINELGKVSEAAESTLYLIDNDGTLITPTTTSDILCSINRKLIIQIWRDLGRKIVERAVDRTELYTAKEVFICNTAKLIRSVIDIDRITIGNATHPQTDLLMKELLEVIRGNNTRYLNNSILLSDV